MRNSQFITSSKSISKYIAIKIFNHTIIRSLISENTDHLATIFMMHRIKTEYEFVDGHSVEFLRETLEYIKNNNYSFVSVNTLISNAINKKVPIKRAVAFTMDDGYKDQLELAAPIFIEYKCPVTIFVITDFIEKNKLPWDGIIKQCFNKYDKNKLSLKINGRMFDFKTSSNHDKLDGMRVFREYCRRLSEEDKKNAIDCLVKITGYDMEFDAINNKNSFAWDDARSIELSNYVDFAPHSVTHPIMSNLTNTQASSEIKSSWNKLKLELLNPVHIFAFPTGMNDDFKQRDINYLIDYGYDGALTAEPGYLDQRELTHSELAKFNIKRFGLPDNLLDLEQYCSGLEYIKDKYRKRLEEIWRNKSHNVKNTVSYLKYIFGLYREYENIDWEKIKRIIFVCKGNICRSPYAECRAKSMGITAESIGVHATIKAKATENAIKQAAFSDVDLGAHISSNITEVNYQDSDLIVCMEEWQIDDILSRKNINLNNAQITLMGLWGKPKAMIHSFHHTAKCDIN